MENNNDFFDKCFEKHNFTELNNIDYSYIKFYDTKF